LRARDHRGRQIDSNEVRGEGPKHRSSQSGAAAQIEQRLKSHWPSKAAIHRRFHRFAENRRATIMQLLNQRGIVARGVLVEEPAQIGFGHSGGGIANAKLRKLQPRAMIIFGVAAARFGEGRRRALPIAEAAAKGAEREPCGGKTRRSRNGLRQDVRCRGKVPAGGEVHRRIVTAIGNKIAGGHKERAGIGHQALAPWHTLNKDIRRRTSPSNHRSLLRALLDFTESHRS
jgi:hypothetical protein